LNREAIPEFLQGACRADLLAAAVEDLLKDAGRRDEQASAYTDALRKLSPKGGSPAALAADVVLDTVTKG